MQLLLLTGKDLPISVIAISPTKYLRIGNLTKVSN